MNARDSRLSAEERAALAHLEATATAADPHLASRLRGSGPARFGAVGAKARHNLAMLASKVTHLGWWGVLVAAVGLSLTVLAVSTSVWLGVGGVLVAVAGLISVAHAVEHRLTLRSAAARREGPSPD